MTARQVRIDPAFAARAPWLRRTFGDALAWAADVHRGRDALIHGATRLTFDALERDVHAFARGLVALGVAPGEHVALWMSDSTDWMIARWAVPLVGAVLIPINTRFREDDLRFVLANCDAATLVMEEAAPGGTSYLDLLRRIVPDADAQPVDRWRSDALPSLRRVVARGSALPESIRPFADVSSGTVDDETWARRLAAVSSDDVAQILYTSGTTSFPKGAMLRHGALLQNNAATVERMHLTTADRYLSSVPLFSATGTSYTLSMLLAGAAIVIADRFDPATFCALVERERISVAFFVDTIVKDLVGFSERGRYDLSSLRTGTGAPLSRDAFVAATTVLGVPELIGVFGMSETSNAVTRGDCGDSLERRMTTNGRPVPGVEVRIVDVASEVPLPVGRIGEIRVRGFNVMCGYYRQPDEDAKAFDADGWLKTGDLGELDDDGHLAYRGRVKEMIKPGGFNVATLEIETFLKTHPSVREAVVVGVPDARLGEVAYAYVQRHDGVALAPDDVIAYCRARIASYKVPRHVEFVDVWPLTGTEKIRKLALRDAARAKVAADRRVIA